MGDSAAVPSCTGSGTDVETIHSLLHSIQTLVSNTDKVENIGDPPKDPQYHVNDLNNFESLSEGTVKVEDDDDLLKLSLYRNWQMTKTYLKLIDKCMLPYLHIAQ